MWEGKFGIAYTKRNMHSPIERDADYFEKYGISRNQMNWEFLEGIDHSVSVLEVGCNIGTQLEYLRDMGFSNLYGVDVNEYALQIAGQGFNVSWAEASALPFADRKFELVFTSGVLIHILPEDLKNVLSEIYRVSNHYIWGFEYYAPEREDVEYRGGRNALWRGDYAKEYMKLFKNLILLKERKYKYLGSDKVDTMFLLEKV